MTVVVENRARLNSAREVTVPDPQPSTESRTHQIGPVFVVSVGLLATVAWVALLGWLLYRVALMLAA